MESKYCILKRHHQSSFDMVTKVGGNNETTLSRHRARLSWLQNYKKISLSKNTFRQPILKFLLSITFFFFFILPHYITPNIMESPLYHQSYQNDQIQLENIETSQEAIQK